MEEERTEEATAVQQPVRHHRDWLGTLIGLAVFLVGIGILYVVFTQALELFRTPPKVEMKVQAGKPVDVASAYNSLLGVLQKVISLILMAWLGSIIANRGIFLYSHSRVGRKT